MIYITRNLRPAPESISVSDKILPPVNDFNILVVAAPTLTFLFFAPTAIPITGASVFIVGFKNFDHAV